MDGGDAQTGPSALSTSRARESHRRIASDRPGRVELQVADVGQAGEPHRHHDADGGPPSSSPQARSCARTPSSSPPAALPRRSWAGHLGLPAVDQLGGLDAGQPARHLTTAQAPRQLAQEAVLRLGGPAVG